MHVMFLIEMIVFSACFYWLFLQIVEERRFDNQSWLLSLCCVRHVTFSVFILPVAGKRVLG